MSLPEQRGKGSVRDAGPRPWQGRLRRGHSNRERIRVHRRRRRMAAHVAQARARRRSRCPHGRMRPRDSRGQLGDSGRDRSGSGMRGTA